jgi:hypothetical protein
MTSYSPKRPRDLSHLVAEGLQHSLLGEILCEEDDFGKPRRLPPLLTHAPSWVSAMTCPLC